MLHKAPESAIINWIILWEVCPVLYTLCLNPAFDRTAHVENLTVGGVNRTLSTSLQSGGKGVNVAYAAQLLGMESCVYLLLGEDNGDTFLKMLPRPLKSEVVFAKGMIRTNTAIVDVASGVTTQLNESGTVEDPSAVEKLLRRLMDTVKQNDTVVLTGSLPAFCPRTLYAAVGEKLTEMGVRVVLDASSEALLAGLKTKPFLIKPTGEELSETLHCPVDNREEIIEAAQKMRVMGAQNVLVSLGAEGAMLVTEEGVYTCKAPKVEARSAIGAGDTMVAGFLYGLTRGTMEDALKMAVACGTASVMTDGTGLKDKDAAMRLFADMAT